MTAKITPNGSGVAGKTESYTYDMNNNQLTMTDATGTTTRTNDWLNCNIIKMVSGIGKSLYEYDLAPS